MGTRNLTLVVKDGAFKVAQYCQWDGYPSGEGVKVLAHVRFLLSEGYDRFVTNLAKCRFIGEAEHKALIEKAGVKTDTGWVNMDEADRIKKALPQLHRDLGSDVLKFIYDFQGSEIPLVDSHEFAGDGLFCEWAYLLDLDKKTLEVYEGFQEGKTLASGERFAHLAQPDAKYAPVALRASFKLGELPSEAEFLKQLGEEE